MSASKPITQIDQWQGKEAAENQEEAREEWQQRYWSQTYDNQNMTACALSCTHPLSSPSHFFLILAHLIHNSSIETVL